ncbi:MAG: prepilin-type N-terminal cleavage/methylation domain-containing protein [Magnetococcales bacterium]|nr:prepilin-type N-terminal cleavage/methylation domain-containing protein [Magnetococcales bacterium]
MVARSPAGFTLLEVLIALTISALLLSGVYRVTGASLATARAIETRAETLHEWIHLRRVLGRDREFLATEPPVAGIVVEGRETVILKASGEVVPEWRLGPWVEILYQWRPNPSGDGVIWERRVLPLGGKREEAELTLRIDQGLTRVEWEIYSAQGWHPFGEGGKPPWLGMRWRFDWRVIGDWRLVLQLPMGGVGHADPA